MGRDRLLCFAHSHLPGNTRWNTSADRPLLPEQKGEKIMRYRSVSVNEHGDRATREERSSDAKLADAKLRTSVHSRVSLRFIPVVLSRYLGRSRRREIIIGDCHRESPAFAAAELLFELNCEKESAPGFARLELAPSLKWLVRLVNSRKLGRVRRWEDVGSIFPPSSPRPPQLRRAINGSSRREFRKLNLSLQANNGTRSSRNFGSTLTLQIPSNLRSQSGDATSCELFDVADDCCHFLSRIKS